MAFPLGLIGKLVGPVTKIIGIDTGGDKIDAPLTKNWRPIMMVVFGVLIVVSFFTNYELDTGLLTVIGLVMSTYVGGRSYEKKNIEKIIDKIIDHEEDKQKRNES